MIDPIFLTLLDRQGWRLVPRTRDPWIFTRPADATAPEQTIQVFGRHHQWHVCLPPTAHGGQPIFCILDAPNTPPSLEAFFDALGHAYTLHSFVAGLEAYRQLSLFAMEQAASKLLVERPRHLEAVDATSFLTLISSSTTGDTETHLPLPHWLLPLFDPMAGYLFPLQLFPVPSEQMARPLSSYETYLSPSRMHIHIPTTAHARAQRLHLLDKATSVYRSLA